MNVLFASDDNYAPLLGVTINSLLKNNSDSEYIKIFIFDSGISNENKDKLNSMINEFDIETDVEFISVKNIDEVIGIDIKASRPLSAYARLFAASLLPDDINRIFYLDCDALVTGSLKSLWHRDISNYDCAGVLDAGPTYIKTFIGLTEWEDYFNSGFFLINLKRWRKNNIEQKFIDYLIENDGEVFHNDQGIINAVCRYKILKIHPKYNILSPFFEVGYSKVLKWYEITNYYNPKLIEEAMDDPVFLHLTTFVYGRPWFTNAMNHPLHDLFDSYVKGTPFEGDVYREDDRKFNGRFLSLSYKYLPYSVICVMFRVYRFVFKKRLTI